MIYSIRRTVKDAFAPVRGFDSLLRALLNIQPWRSFFSRLFRSAWRDVQSFASLIRQKLFPKAHKPRILLISTDQVWHRNLEEAMGAQVQMVGNEGLELLKRFPYDLVIVDALGEASEEEWASEVREIRRSLKGAKVLVVSSSPTWRRVRAALRAGAVDVWLKTQDKRKLREDARELLAQKDKGTRERPRTK